MSRANNRGHPFAVFAHWFNSGVPATKKKQQAKMTMINKDHYIIHLNIALVVSLYFDQ